MPNFKDTPVEPVTPQGGGIGPEEAQKDPKVQEYIKKAKGYETVLKQLIHGKQTRDEVVQMLKSNPDPFVVLPEAIMTINDMGLMTMKQGGVNVEPSVQMIASQYLVDDLIQLGTAAAGLKVSEDDVPALIEDTYQMYIERGLKDKSIDPIQLQLEAQKAMDDDQMTAGLVAGQGAGVPQQPTQEARMSQYANEKVNTALKSERAKGAEKQARGKQQQMTQMALAKGGM